MVVKFITFIALAFIFTACVSEPEVNTNTPEGLYKLGEFYRDQERYDEAITQFKTLSNKFPYSKLSIESELQVADSYYKREEYVEAAAAYKTFKELHPRHPRIDYVTYMAAESLREQLPSTVDRDLTQAFQAITFYDEVMNVYPQSQYAKEAKEKRMKLNQMLADKEIYIADFYYRQSRYISAVNRYELFLQSYPQNQRVPHVLLNGARAAVKADLPEKVSQFLGPLVSNYPDTTEAKTARREFPNAAR